MFTVDALGCLLHLFKQQNKLKPNCKIKNYQKSCTLPQVHV